MSVSTEQVAEIVRLFYAEHWRVGTICGQLRISKRAPKVVTSLKKKAGKMPISLVWGGITIWSRAGLPEQL